MLVNSLLTFLATKDPIAHEILDTNLHSDIENMNWDHGKLFASLSDSEDLPIAAALMTGNINWLESQEYE